MHVLADEVGVQPQHSVAETRELAISPRVRAHAGGVIPAIYFHDQARGAVSRRCEHESRSFARKAPPCAR